MQNWDQIKRNARKTGTFAGRTPKDSDAFYDFFANDRPRLLHRLKTAAHRFMAR